MNLVDKAPTKPDVEESDQKLEEDKPDVEEVVEHEDEITAEPLGPIFITDTPTTTIQPPATAEKWPTEPPTTPSIDSDVDNEA